jgi:hypothetical protein
MDPFPGFPVELGGFGKLRRLVQRYVAGNPGSVHRRDVKLLCLASLPAPDDVPGW